MQPPDQCGRGTVVCGAGIVGQGRCDRGSQDWVELKPMNVHVRYKLKLSLFSPYLTVGQNVSQIRGLNLYGVLGLAMSSRTLLVKAGPGTGPYGKGYPRPP
jgi:hypothetical protein